MRRILVSAYACEPLKGSEPAVGWNWVIQLARNNIVHVITRSNNQTVIEKHFPDGLENNLFFHYYDTPKFIRNFKNRDKGLYFYNFCWQIGIVRLASQIIKRHSIDYAIHLTFGSMWMPTFLPFLNVRFIWGPIGGGECVPESFLKVLPLKQRLLQFFRYLLNWTAVINPFIMLPAIKADTILARTPNTKNVIPFFLRKKTEVLLETAMDEQIFQRHKLHNESECVEMIVSARFISIKNIPTVIRSLKHIKNEKKWHLTLLGSGPDLGLIKKTIKTEEQNDNITIIPYLPREEGLNFIEKSDVFIFPSLKEGGTWALMEAMAIGLPVVCVDWAGMAVETTSDTAIQLQVTNPKQMEKDMGEALSRLINDTNLRNALGTAARKRIKDVFSWETKGRFMEDLFKRLEKHEA